MEVHTRVSLMSILFEKIGTHSKSLDSDVLNFLSKLFFIISSCIILATVLCAKWLEKCFLLGLVDFLIPISLLYDSWGDFRLNRFIFAVYGLALFGCNFFFLQLYSEIGTGIVQRTLKQKRKFYDCCINIILKSLHLLIVRLIIINPICFFIRH